MCGAFFYDTGGWVRERGLVVSLVGTMTLGCYKWISISSLCT